MGTITHNSRRQTWLSDNIMNLLVDYYPEVQFRPYGSGLIGSESKVVSWLKKLRPGYICVYAKGHSGYTTWHSSLKTAHNMLAIDMCEFFREATKKANIKLIFYYSGLTDGIAGMRHPEWRMKNPDGTDKELFSDFKILLGYGNCPLSSYFDEWVAIHLKELITNYDPDGIWVDGDWAGPCYCERCQTRFRKETGIKETWSELVKRKDFPQLYQPVWNKIESEWRERFNLSLIHI